MCFGDGEVLDLSKDRVKEIADEYWNDPSKLPAHIKEHEDFKTCSVCPYRGQAVFCSAMKPLLPFLEAMEKFTSCDKVTATYIKGGVSYTSEIPVQNALQYVTNMALFEYCEDAKKYHKYFKGILPFMDSNEAACRIFLNIFWLAKGGRWRTNRIIDEMKRTITVTSKSCVKRLNLMCKSDAFMNAYVKTQIVTEMLSFKVDTTLAKYFL